MKKIFFTSLFLVALAFNLGASPVQAEGNVDVEQAEIEKVTNQQVIPVPFEELSEETKATIISEGIDIANTTFYKDIQETTVTRNNRLRGYLGIVINYYFIDQTLYYNSNILSQSGQYGHTYREINVRNGYSYQNLYYHVSTKAKTNKYRTDKLKVVRQYRIW
jgi:hypothetical protein